MEAFLNLFKDRVVGYAVLAFVIFTGVVDIKMGVDPNSRPDANTGEQGRARDKLIEQLQYDVEELTANVMDWETVCENRYDDVTNQVGRHDERIRHNNDLIRDCMKRTMHQ